MPLRLPSCYFAAPKNAVKSERCLSEGYVSTRSESSSLGIFVAEKRHTNGIATIPLQAKASAGMIIYIVGMV